MSVGEASVRTFNVRQCSDCRSGSVRTCTGYGLALESVVPIWLLAEDVCTSRDVESVVPEGCTWAAVECAEGVYA